MDEIEKCDWLSNHGLPFLVLLSELKISLRGCYFLLPDLSAVGWTTCSPPGTCPSPAVCPPQGPPSPLNFPPVTVTTKGQQWLGLRQNFQPVKRNLVLTVGRLNSMRRPRSWGPVWTFPPSEFPLWEKESGRTRYLCPAVLPAPGRLAWVTWLLPPPGRSPPASLPPTWPRRSSASRSPSPRWRSRSRMEGPDRLPACWSQAAALSLSTPTARRGAARGSPAWTAATPQEARPVTPASGWRGRRWGGECRPHLSTTSR